MKTNDMYNGLTKEQWMELRDYIWEYYDSIGDVLERRHVSFAMDMFANKFDLTAMYRFLVWAKNEEMEDSWIMAQIGHDLNGVYDEFFSPRTGGYQYEQKYLGLSIMWKETR